MSSDDFPWVLWVQINSLEFLWVSLSSLMFPGVPLSSLRFSWVPLDSFGFCTILTSFSPFLYSSETEINVKKGSVEICSSLFLYFSLTCFFYKRFHTQLVWVFFYFRTNSPLKFTSDAKRRRIKWEYISHCLHYNATYDMKYLESTLGSAKMKKQSKFLWEDNIPHRLHFGMTSAFLSARRALLCFLCWSSSSFQKPFLSHPHFLSLLCFILLLRVLP